jgi:hypothetical protein
VRNFFLCIDFFCKMVDYLQLLFICSQDEDYEGRENFFQPPSQFPTSAFRSYIQNPSSTSRNLI